jgi:hypothetical protein
MQPQLIDTETKNNYEPSVRNLDGNSVATLRSGFCNSNDRLPLAKLPEINSRISEKYRSNILVGDFGFRNLGVRDKLNRNAYYCTSSLQLISKNKAGASCESGLLFGLSRKLPNAPACPLLTYKKFA